MTRNPLSIDKDNLAAKSLSIMSENKITSLCVHKNNNKKKTIGILHIHHILSANIPVYYTHLRAHETREDRGCRHLV